MPTTDNVANAVATRVVTSALRAFLFLYGIAYGVVFVIALGTAIVFQGFGQGHQVFSSSADRLFTGFVLICHLACSWYALRLPRHRFNWWLSYLLIAFPTIQSLAIGFSSLTIFMLEGFSLIAWYIVLRVTAVGRLTPIIPVAVVSFVVFGYFVVATGPWPPRASDADIDKYIIGSAWKTSLIWSGVTASGQKLSDSARLPLVLNADGSAAGYNSHGSYSGYTIKQGKLVMLASNSPMEKYVILHVDETSLWLGRTLIETGIGRQFPDVIRYERVRKHIDGNTFGTTPLFKGINGSKEWTSMVVGWFDASVVNASYEMGDCDLRYFDTNGEFIQIITQACYRKRGESVIHLDIPGNHFIPYQLRVGTWKLVDGRVHVETRIAEYGSGCTNCADFTGNKNTDTYVAAQPGSASRFSDMYPLSVNDVPQFPVLRKRAIEMYRRLPPL